MPGRGPEQLKSAPEEESMETLVQQVINGLVLGSLYALDRARLHDGLRGAEPDQFSRTVTC